MNNPFSSNDETFLFQGPAGDIEVLTSVPPKSVVPRAATVIICHPHPLHGGTMNNKVVSTLAKTFHELGLRTVRFNFRGVGKTAGHFDDGSGETADVLALAKWLVTLFPQDKIWLAGFSFGAFVATCAAIQLQPAVLVCVAPQVSRFLSTKLPPVSFPWLIIQGEEDEIVSPQAVIDWVDTLKPKPRLIMIPGVGHFFHGRLIELKKTILESLDLKSSF